MNRASFTRAVALLCLALQLLLVGGDLLSNRTWLKRKQDRAILEDRVSDYVSSRASRKVDVGVELRVVVADPVNGTRLIKGKPLLCVLRTHHFGGILDTRANPPCLVAGSQRPQIWYCSVDQEEVLLHGGDPLGQLVYGSEGAGKTTVTAIWHYLRWIEHVGEGRIGAQTAPTGRRLRMVRREMVRLWPKSWYTHKKSEDVFVLCDGTTIEFISTHRASEEEGSRVQGQNWSWCAREEGQDQVHAHEDIESRGRDAKDDRYQQLITATAKDSTVWRTFRDMLTASGQWVRRTLLGRRSPFVAPGFWDKKLKTMSPREYARRVDAEDVPPELAVYYCWTRDRNLIARPELGKDVTAAVLSTYKSYVRPRSRFVLLVGHDPGIIFNTSIIYRLIVFGAVPVWVVVGEVQTKQTTARQHADELRRYLAKNFGVERYARDRLGREVDDPESSKALVFVDPHGKGESQTDYQSVYMAFQQAGLDVFSPTKGKIKRTARVEMTNRLLGDAGGEVRLAIATVGGAPVAPVLVESFETLEKRPGDDDPEGVRRKDEDDRTHAPAAAAYGVWVFEQEAFTRDTVKRALAAARSM